MALETADEVYEKVVKALPELEQRRLADRIEQGLQEEPGEPGEQPPTWESLRGILSEDEPIRRGRSWMEIRGIAPNLLGGEDAQEWVNRLRRGAEEARAEHVPNAYDAE